ncbi:MAG: flagellar brake protein [Lachnospiraceae bacterium]|nr:flagellar brake protein [Lachnospiraceae bacterium]
MLNEYIKPGNVLEIVTESKNTDDALEGRNNLRTKIYDIVSDDVIKAVIPSEQGKLKLLPVGGEYDVFFYTSNGLYQCNCNVKDRYRANAIPIMELELMSNLRKYQRREYYRLNCMLSMKCHELQDDEVDAFKRTGMVREGMEAETPAVIVDISGGGARFVSYEQYEIGTLILFRFNITHNGKLKRYSIVGRVIKSDILEGQGNRYTNRAQFVDIDNADRESIIKYIFDEERRIRKNS